MVDITVHEVDKTSIFMNVCHILFAHVLHFVWDNGEIPYLCQGLVPFGYLT